MLVDSWLSPQFWIPVFVFLCCCFLNWFPVSRIANWKWSSCKWSSLSFVIFKTSWLQLSETQPLHIYARIILFQHTFKYFPRLNNQGLNSDCTIRLQLTLPIACLSLYVTCFQHFRNSNHGAIYLRRRVCVMILEKIFLSFYSWEDFFFYISTNWWYFIGIGVKARSSGLF